MPLQKQCAHLFVRGRTSSVLYFSLAPEPDLSEMAKALSLSVCSSIHSTPPSHLDLLLYYRFPSTLVCIIPLEWNYTTSFCNLQAL